MRKTSTRVLSAILAIVMVIGLVPMMTISSSAAFNDPSLKFDANGNFTVIQIADIQEDTDVHDTTLALISKAMNKYEPDLVVFTGDNVESGSNESEFKTIVQQYLVTVFGAGARVAWTFGNHDAEDRSSVNTAWDKQSQYNHVLSMSPLAIDFDEPGLSGVGTGSIPIYSNDGSRVAFCVFPIDSGMYDANDDYDYVKTDQINWYASESARLAGLNNGNPVPTLVFQHIPVPEIYSNLLVEASQGEPGAVSGQTRNYSSRYWKLDPNNPTITGTLGEGPCPPTVNNGQYQGWLDVGNVVGAFFGHDHKNDFVGTDANGITMGYCKAATLEAYHSDDNDPGIRVFNIKENGTYTTESVTYTGMSKQEEHEYERDEISGTPTVPEVLYVGAADNGIGKQEYGTTIQPYSLNYKTQSLYNNDLTVTIDLNKDATDVTLTAQGLSFSPVSVTAKDSLTSTYTWTISGGSANAGTVVEYKVDYKFDSQPYTQYAYSYVDDIKSPPGHYAFVRNYGGLVDSNEAYWNTQNYVMTVLGDDVYGNARATSDPYSNGDVGGWSNAPAGYYNYTLSSDAGFVQKDLSYGLNYCSPSRIRNHDQFPRFRTQGLSPVATIYADTSVASSLTDLGISINYWRHASTEHNTSTTFATAFKQGDVGYEHNNWNTDTVGTATISTQGATLPSARTSNVSVAVTGGAIPADGTMYTFISRGHSYYDGGLYDTDVNTYFPVLFKFHTYNKGELRTLLNAERTANRQFRTEEEKEKETVYRAAFKEAFKQIQKPDTNQTDINNAKGRLEKAIENLTFTGNADLSQNGEYYMNSTVPSKLYIAGAGYGLSAQPKGNTIQRQIVNFRTRQMISYSNFHVDLPSGATNATVKVTNVNTGQDITDNCTWDEATCSGEVAGGTANVGDTIMYEFTYELNGRSYTQYEASTVTDAPQASGWLTWVRRSRQYSWDAHTSQKTSLYFAPEGAPIEGIQYEALQGNSGFDGRNLGVNLTSFDGEGSQKGVAGYGINSWIDPERQSNGGWYAGSNGKNDTQDVGARAKFNVFFDSSVVTDITQAKIMFIATSLGAAENESQGYYLQNATYYLGQGNHGAYGQDLGNLNSAAMNLDGSAAGDEILGNTAGDSLFKYLQVDDLADGGFTYYTQVWNKTNDGDRALTCHYAWHINMKTVDKTNLRNAVAAEDELFRQLSDGYSDDNGKWTAYVNALAKAKSAIADSSLTEAENDAAMNALTGAAEQLEYARANYDALEAQLNKMCQVKYTDEVNKTGRYFLFRPNPINDPLYTNSGYYSTDYFNVSANEIIVPIEDILDNKMNLDSRYQSVVDDLVDVLVVGWQNVQLRDANYEVVDEYLSYKTGTNDNGSTGGLEIILPDIEKYAAFADLENRSLSWELYTTESYNAWANACAPAMSNRSLKSIEQPTVDGYAAALQAAYEGLELKKADYTALDNKIAEATSNIDAKIEVVDPSDAANNYMLTYYDPAYLAQLEKKIAEKKDGLYILQQEEVDVLEYEIDQIYIGLGNHLSEADFHFAEQQKGIKADYEDEYAKYYTEASWNRLVAARKAVDDGLNYGYMAGEQVTVNAIAKEVYDARNELEFNPADYGAVNSWLAKIAELEPTKNDYVNWADVETAKAAVVKNLDITKQGEVDEMAAGLETAYNALKLKDADYTKLNAQITKVNEEIIPNKDLFTPGSYTNFLGVYNEALTFYMAEPKQDIQHQNVVDAQEDALIAAIAQLDYVDATIAPLEDALSNYYAVDYYAYEAEYPTDTDEDGIVDIYEDVNDKYEAANALMTQYNNGELDIRNNAEIRAAADALNAALNNLPALYANVDWEIEQIPEDYYTTPQKYTATSRDKLAAALAAVDRTLKIGDQERVEAMATAINEAVAGLVETNADLTALNAAIAAADAKIAGVDTTTYTDASWAAYQDAYNAATAVRDADPAYLYSQQADVDAAEEALENATAGLTKKPADYSAIEDAIAETNGLDKDDWTDESWAELQDAIAAANNLPKDLTVDDQATIDAAAQAIRDAKANLDEAKFPCDYTALDAAIAAAAGADKVDCTSASIATFEAALAAANAVERGMFTDKQGVNQKAINDAAKALNDAITGLTKLGNCDYSQLDAALSKAVNADTADCTSASIATFDAAFAAAQAIKRDMIADEPGVNQKAINDAAKALNDAITGLQKLPACNYAALDAALAAAAEADTENRTEASIAEFETALAAAQAVKRDMVADEAGVNQGEIDEAAQNLNDAIAGLQTLPPCDYTALDAAIAAYEAEVANKDLYSNWAGYEAAYNDAKAVERDMYADEDDANQTTINDAEEALRIAGEILEYKPADYSAVEAAKATIPADLTIYTSASVKAVNDAVAAVVTGYNITKQAEVNEMAAAIAEAVNKLVPLGNCNYEALDAAIAKTPAKDKDAYSTVSWNNYADALAAAQAVTRDMLNDEAGVNQAIVDAAAKALTDAYNALADKEFCDYSALEEAILYCSELDADEAYYDAAALTEWRSALTAAQTLLAAEKLEKTDDNQAIINNAAAALFATYDELYELYVDLAVLEAAVENYGEHKIENEIERYEPDTWAAYEAALAAAQEGLVTYDIAPDTQENRDAVAQLAQTLADAYNALELIQGYCDYTLLEEAVLYCSELDAAEEYYDAAALAQWKDALVVANDLLNGEPLYLTGANQALIDVAAAALFATYDELYELYVDLAPLAEAVENYGEHKIENEIERYEANTWAAYEDALTAAQAGLVGYDFAPDTQENRDAVAKLAQDLADAYNNLKLITDYCNYEKLEEAVRYCSELDADEAYYNATDLAEWKDALAAAKEILDGEPLYLTDANQAIIDGAADALIKEYMDLYEIYVDLAPLAEAVENYGEHKIENEIERYTPDSWATYEAALAAAQAGLIDYEFAPNTEEAQAAVAQLAQDLADAFNGLQILGNCDYSELNKAIAAYEDKLAEKDLYKNWAEYEAAYDAAKAVDPDMIDDAEGANQAIIDAAAKALNDVVLVYKDADYSAVEDAKATIPADLSTYTDESVQAVNDAVAAVVPGLDITKQADVDKMAADIADAVAKLAKKPADYTALEAAIDRAEALNKDDWTPESWANVESTLAAANELDKALNIDNQPTIDAAAKALNDAIDALQTAEVPLLLKAKEGSTTIIDRERGFIYGLDSQGVNAWSEIPEITDLLAQNFVEIEGDGRLEYTYVGNNTVLGTGAKVEFINNKTNEVVETFYIVIFGDNDGDGVVAYPDMTDPLSYLAWDDYTYDYDFLTDANAFAMDLDLSGDISYADFTPINSFLAWDIDFISQVR